MAVITSQPKQVLGEGRRTKQLLQSATGYCGYFFGCLQGVVDLGAKVWRRHDGITSSYSVSFAFCGEFLRCNAGVAPQVRCGSSLRSLQPGGGEWEWAGFKLPWDRMEFNACRVALPPVDLFLPLLMFCFTEKRGMCMLVSYSDWALSEDWSSNTIYS